MPAVKLRKRVSPTNPFNKALQQINGLYVHSSPPKGHYRLLADIEEITTLYVHTCPPRVLQMNPSVIRQWLRGGEIDQLEQVVLEGQGHKLIGEYAHDPKVRHFLKIVPTYMNRIGAVNDAVNKGELKRVKELLQVNEVDSVMKNIALCKDLSGVGLLHKAVYRDHPDIVEYLVNTYPQTVHIKDRDGKTALHYCGACGDPEQMWYLLVNAGADPNVVDVKGRTAAHYMERPGDIELPEPKLPSGSLKRFTSGKDGLVVKPSNIRIWIHDRDLGRLQQVIWEGHGGKLRTETSNNPKVKRFLDGVPYIMNAIKDVHAAVINNDFEQYIKKTSDPIPLEILGSKDVNGLNPLHKAAGLGRRRIVEDILERSPKLVFTTDAEGRTPLHYAATLKDSGAIYDLLIDNGADEMAFDSNGKMASYYKQNPKELPNKVLEVIPDAPRTSVTFPPTWDWGLLQSSLMGSVSQIGSIMTNQMRAIEQNKREFEDNNRNRLRMPDDMFGREPERMPPREPERLPLREPEKLPPKEEISTKKEAPPRPINKEPSIEKNSKPNKGVDIWTNTEEDKNNHQKTDDEDEGEEEEEEEEEQNVMVINKGYESDHRNEQNNLRNRVESDDEDLKRMNARNEQPSPKKAIGVIPVAMKSRETSFDREETKEQKEQREKSEREIGEERQRMLDEGLIKPPRDDYEDDFDGNQEDDIQSGDDEVDGIIRNGDMEKLASMVLNGEGDKLLGKRSRNPEIQSFLDNVPIYMTKIKTVHKAAREGEIRELQAALDRRRFAIAKDSSNPLGVTPLHVATLFGRTPIVKYLGGRFPETLNAKDKNGRTPLHYAATIPDNGHYFNVLLNLGADRKVKDSFGHVPGYYLENPGQLTQDALLREFNAPAQIAREILSDKVPNDTVSSRRNLQDAEVIAMLNQCRDIIQGARDKESTMPLVKFLNKRLFDKIKLRITKNDRNLLDVIWPGIRILQETGIGKSEEDDDYDDFDMSGGVIAPDYESYVVFEDLIFPMIKDMHNLGGKIALHPKATFFKKDDVSSQAELVVKSDPDLDNGGIVAPDYESYQVFEEVMMPIVKDIHGIEAGERLKKHPESEFFPKDSSNEENDEMEEKEIRPKTRKRVDSGRKQSGSFFKDTKKKVKRMIGQKENESELEEEEKEKEENPGILKNFKNRMSKIVKRTEEETDSEDEEKKPKKKGIMKELREKVNQMIKTDNESESENIVESIKNKVRNLRRKSGEANTETEVENEKKEVVDSENSKEDSDADIVTREKERMYKSKAIKKRKDSPMVEEDRTKTAVIRRKASGKPVGNVNVPYKTTRTQILREELRLKQEEEMRKQKELEEKQKSRFTKRGKEVNILILDHDEETNTVHTIENSNEENDNEDNEKKEEEIEEKRFLDNFKDKVQKFIKREDVNGNEIQINGHDPKSDMEESPKLEITNLDPTSKYVISAKIECSRNLEKYQFPATLREDELDIIETKLKSALKYQSIIGAEGVTVNGGVIVGFGSKNFKEEERYYTVQDILTRPTTVRAKLAANELLIPLAENTGSYHCSMLHGSFWPNYRGVYLSKNGNLAAWINVQEHLRIVSCTPIESPGNIGEAYARLAHLAISLDKHLKPKRSPRFGFLTSRPCCLGNTLRFQALVRLPRLAKEQFDSVEEFCKSRSLIFSRTNESDFVFKIRNRQCLGINEYDTYHNFATTVIDIIQLEKDLAQEKSKHVSTILKNIFTKKNFGKEEEVKS